MRHANAEAMIIRKGVTTIGQMTDGYAVKKGDTVMIHTVAGGVGLLHAQYAKLKGATVIGTTSTPEKAQLAKENGADHVILYKSENVVERVLELTGGEGAHVVYDGVGKDTCVIRRNVLSVLEWTPFAGSKPVSR